MPFDVVKFAKDFRIDYTTTHHHCSPGWVNVHCPFCKGSDNFHLGIHPQTGHCHCWRCQGHSLKNTIKSLLGNPHRHQVDAVLDKYIVGKMAGRILGASKREYKKGEKNTSLPIEAKSLSEAHKKYLRSRNFDPEKLEDLYQLKGTGAIGNYKFRIIAPIYYEGRLVSYQGRDITGKSELRYKACTKAMESRPHKHCLYGEDLIINKNSIVVVEGITDAWRLGVGAVATFGIEWTVEQANLLSQYKNVFVMYDLGGEAPVQADKLCNLISLQGVNAEKIILKSLAGKDPADLTQIDADKIMEYLLACN